MNKNVIRKNFLLLSIYLFFGFMGFCQKLNWVKQMGGTNSESAFSIKIDKQGNIYTAGNFYGTVDFDPGPGTYNLTANSGGVFVCKLDNSGNFLWARHFLGTNAITGLGMDLDGAGNVFSTGYFTGTADFDPGVGKFNLTSTGDRDIFISKLDKDGNFAWAKKVGGARDDHAFSIATDSKGAAYITGNFFMNVDFDPGPGVFNLTVVGRSDAFILKLDAAGNFIWVKQLGGKESDYGSSIMVDLKGDVITTGNFQDTIDFDPGVGVFNIPATGTQDMFIHKLDSSGNFLWAKRIGGADFNRSNSIGMDKSGSILITGYFEKTADFDPGPGVFNLTSVGSRDIFICKLDSAGNFRWAKQMGGADLGEGMAVSADNEGNVYTVGNFWGKVDFNPGAKVFNLVSAGKTDIFISKLDPNGNFLSALSFGQSDWDYGYAITVDKFGAIFSTGGFGGKVDFDPGKRQFDLTPLGYQDIFVLKLGKCVEIDTLLNIDACNFYASQGRGYIWTKTGYYLDTLAAADGCDSIMRINLKVTTIDTGITYKNGTLKANYSEGKYQWLDCNKSLSSIPGETKQSFTPTMPGKYAVLIEKDLCAEFSWCYTILELGIMTNKPDENLRVYPNPTKGDITIDPGKSLFNVRVSLSNAHGQEINTKNYGKITQLNYSIKGPPGLYFMTVTTDDMKILRLKIFKE